MGKGNPHKISPENIESVKLLSSLGYPGTTIAKKMGVNPSQISRWLKKEDVELDQSKEAKELRRLRNERLADKAEEVFDESTKWVLKGLRGGETKPLDAAKIAGIYFDKMWMIRGMKDSQRITTEKHTILIQERTIEVAADGDPDSVIAEPVQFYDEYSEIPSDDSGSGVREDLLSLPGSDSDGNSVSG